MAQGWRSVTVVDLDDDRYILQQREDAGKTHSHEDAVDNHRLVVLDEVSVLRDPEDSKEKLNL